MRLGRKSFFEYHYMCNTHTLYLSTQRSGAEPEVFLLYRMGLSVKELNFSLLGEPLFMK